MQLSFLTGTVAGITPTAGSDMLHIQNLGGREATKSFSGLTLAVGIYTVTFDIGNFNNEPFATFNISFTGIPLC